MLHPSLISIIQWEWGVWNFCQQVQLLTLPIAVPGLVVLEQVAGVVVLEGRGHAAPGERHQAVAGVVLVQLLLAVQQPPGAVARLVVKQFLGVGRVIHPLELVQGVVLVQGRPIQSLLLDAVAVSVVGVAGLRQ